MLPLPGKGVQSASPPAKVPTRLPEGPLEEWPVRLPTGLDASEAAEMLPLPGTRVQTPAAAERARASLLSASPSRYLRGR
eukprot:5213537-Alexandrium_andersonii.AAC.1